MENINCSDPNHTSEEQPWKLVNREAMPLHVMSRHCGMSCHTTSHHVICHDISCHVYCAMSCIIMSCMPCKGIYVTPSWHVVSCHMLLRAMCYDVSRHVVTFSDVRMMWCNATCRRTWKNLWATRHTGTSVDRTAGNKHPTVDCSPNHAVLQLLPLFQFYGYCPGLYYVTRDTGWELGLCSNY